MRISIKYLLFFFIVSAFLLNIYIFSQLQDEDSVEYGFFRFFKRADHKKKNNEFLVLDWTANKHIFKEQDHIKCDFSHITPEYCQSKFKSILNDALRLSLIERCSRLSTLVVRWTADQSYYRKADLLAYHSIHILRNELPVLIRNDQQQQFSTVYILESEINSSGGEYWHQIDFPMWYNLARSYPAPATYFDLQIYLNQLFAPVQVSFSNKRTTAPIICMISNCNANNGRQFLIKQLMSYLPIDSYGACFNNIELNDMKNRKQSKSALYSSYKFVIAIENSNCEDYVSEKLINVFLSGSVPIVAGRNGKPDYRRFTPRKSYINVYDYKSVEELADYLKYLSNNETAYNEYLWFKQLPANKYASSGVIERSLTENLRLADEILGVNATMRQWLLTKETSVNKYCKLAQFIYTNDWKSIDKRKKIDRPTADEVCLPQNDIASYFSISSLNQF